MVIEGLQPRLSTWKVLAPWLFLVQRSGAIHINLPCGRYSCYMFRALEVTPGTLQEWQLYTASCMLHQPGEASRAQVTITGSSGLRIKCRELVTCPQRPRVSRLWLDRHREDFSRLLSGLREMYSETYFWQKSRNTTIAAQGSWL